MNNKRISSICIIIISIIIGAIVIFEYAKRESIISSNDLYIDDAQFDDITSARRLSSQPLTTQLSFDGQTLIYDDETDTFYYSLLEDSDTAYSPEVVTLGGLTVALHGDEINSDIIANNESTELLIYDNKNYSISSLICTTLPVMNIQISPETIEELGLDETYPIEEYTAVDMTFYDNSNDFDGVSRSISSSAKIHMRGGTTISAEQKSYRLSLISDGDDLESRNSENLLGLRDDDDWILFSAYSDYEKVRNVFCMNLWHDMTEGRNQWNASVSDQYKYFELFINGHYHGLYALTYPIDNKEFNLSDDESLFKKKDWTAAEYSIDLEYYEYEDGSGGIYVLPGYSVEDGDANDFDTLHQLYYQMAYTEDADVIRSAADMDNSIDLWLLYKLSMATDNLYGTQVKNLYVSTKQAEDGLDGYKLLFAPWDMDQTFGNRYVDGLGHHGITSYYNTPDYDLPVEWSPAYFLLQIQDPDISSQINERYDSLRESTWSDENIATYIEDYESDIYDSGAFLRTMERWPDGNYYDPSIGLDDFEDFVITRLHYMDSYLEGN